MTKKKIKNLIRECLDEILSEMDVSEIQAPVHRSMSRRDLKRLALDFHSENPGAYKDFLRRGEEEGTYSHVTRDIQQTIKDRYGVDIDINDTEELIASVDPDYSIN